MTTDRDNEEIKARILARKAAEDLLTFVPDMIREHRPDPAKFWMALANIVAHQVGMRLVEETQKEMGIEEALRFESETMNYGHYKDKRIGDIPCSYFLFLTEGEFAKKLRRYVRSQRFMDRQG